MKSGHSTPWGSNSSPEGGGGLEGESRPVLGLGKQLEDAMRGDEDFFFDSNKKT